MKLSALATVAALAFTGCSSQEKPTATPATAAPTAQSAPGTSSAPMASRAAEKSPREKTFSSFDRTPEARKEIGAGAILFNEADVRLVFDLYQELSGRSVIHSPRVPKNIKVTFRNVSPLSRVEVLQALDTVLAAQGIAMVYSGDQYVKACAAAEAPTEVPPMLSIPWRELPDSMSFLSYSVALKTSR